MLTLFFFVCYFTRCNRDTYIPKIFALNISLKFLKIINNFVVSLILHMNTCLTVSFGKLHENFIRIYSSHQNWPIYPKLSVIHQNILFSVNSALFRTYLYKMYFSIAPIIWIVINCILKAMVVVRKFLETKIMLPTRNVQNVVYINHFLV